LSLSPGRLADLSLERGADVDRVVDDVEFADLPVSAKRGHVDDIERRGSTGGGNRQSKWNQKLTVV